MADRPEVSAAAEERSDGDYIFRFRLEDAPPSLYDNRLAQLIRDQLAALLDVVILTRGGETVRVDGFKFINEMDSDREYPLWLNLQRAPDENK